MAAAGFEHDEVTIVRGRVTSVSSVVAGTQLSQNESASVTTLHVWSTDDMEERGGFLTLTTSDGVTSEVVEYLSVDDELLTVTLLAGTANAYSEDDSVQLYPEVIERRAHVILDDSDDDEVVNARVPLHLYALMPEGVRQELDS